jgi:DNA-binding MarR family transcriptional regulator
MRGMTSPATDPAAESAGAPISARDPRLVGWRAFLTAYSVITRQLDDELRGETGLSLFEYAALLHLAEARDRRLRMSDLAQGIVLTRSGVTRLVDRLERDGLVERRHCTTDGRGAEAVLTRTGLERLRSASTVHLRGIERYYLEKVSDADQEVVGRVMADVVEGVRAT